MLQSCDRRNLCRLGASGDSVESAAQAAAYGAKQTGTERLWNARFPLCGCSADRNAAKPEVQIARLDAIRTTGAVPVIAAETLPPEMRVESVRGDEVRSYER